MLSETIIKAMHLRAIQGEKVIVIGRQTGRCFKQAKDSIPDNLINKASRVNGNERIELTNGAEIQFVRSVTRLRGYSASLIIAPIGLTWDEQLDLIPCLAKSTNAEVLGYMP